MLSLIAISSVESELFVILEAAAEGLGVQSVASALGIWLDGEVRADAAAGLGIINRKCLWESEHIDIGMLRVQQTAAKERFDIQ